MVIINRNSLSIAPLFLIACNVSATALSTGGTDGGSDGGTACGQGTVVLLTDYTSTQIALSKLDGTTTSADFLSTAATKASGLAFALSGDVALPNVTPASGRVVLMDRYGTNVVTWADPSSGKVLAQLPVGTGFESNPQDYLELDATRAYITRWGVNDAPGQQPFDKGSDVLVVDTRTPTLAITKSIPLPVESGLPPRPAGMVRVGDTVIAVLQRTSEDFMTQGENALVGLVDDAIAWEIHVTGLKGCGRPSLSPAGVTLALACEGQIDMNGNVVNLGESAIALFDVTSLPPTPGQRFAVVDQLRSPTQDRVVFATETLLLGKTQTPLGGTTTNQAFALDTVHGRTTVLLTAGMDAQGKGKGAVYGDILCRPGCGDVCLLADADVGKLRRFHIVGGAPTPLPDVTVETMTGLPPTALGGY